MKEIILEKLNQMEDLEQRRLLKNVMTGLFEGLIDYQEAANRNLEERVFKEIPDDEQKSVLYFAVCPKAEVDPIDEFLFPVFPEDMAEQKFNLKEIIAKLSNHEEIPLFPVFLECSYPQLCELRKNPRPYQGELVTGVQKYPIQIKLKPFRKYSEEIERLYLVFQRNGVPWKTVNNPYANKFFEVFLTGCAMAINPGEEVKEISFNLEEYEQYKRIDMVLLWNVERLAVKTCGYPLPALDKVNFEHSISLAKLGAGHEYLIDEAEDITKYICRAAEEITIVASEERNGFWNIMKITQPAAELKYPFRLVSNKRRTGFINRFAQKQGTAVRTQSELIRIVNSFEEAAEFQLMAIAISERRYEKCLTYDCNSFLIDDIRVANDKKVMKLQFKTTQPDNYLSYDLLSFLVSEIQMYFPEYDCEGELV